MAWSAELQLCFFSGDVLRTAPQLTERLDQASSKAVTCDSVISVSPGFSLAQLRDILNAYKQLTAPWWRGNFQSIIDC